MVRLKGKIWFSENSLNNYFGNNLTFRNSLGTGKLTFQLDEESLISSISHICNFQNAPT